MRFRTRKAVALAFAALPVYLAFGCGNTTNEAGPGNTRGVAPFSPSTQADYLKESQE